MHTFEVGLTGLTGGLEVGGEGGQSPAAWAIEQMNLPLTEMTVCLTSQQKCVSDG